MPDVAEWPAGEESPRRPAPSWSPAPMARPSATATGYLDRSPGRSWGAGAANRHALACRPPRLQHGALSHHPRSRRRYRAAGMDAPATSKNSPRGAARHNRRHGGGPAAGRRSSDEAHGRRCEASLGVGRCYDRRAESSPPNVAVDPLQAKAAPRSRVGRRPRDGSAADGERWN